MKKFKTLLLPALAVLAAAGLGACQPSGSKAGEEQSAAVQPVESAAEHSGAAAEASIKEDASVVTDDHKLCAHYENTILLTDNGPEILSLNV